MKLEVAPRLSRNAPKAWPVAPLTRFTPPAPMIERPAVGPLPPIPPKAPLWPRVTDPPAMSGLGPPAFAETAAPPPPPKEDPICPNFALLASLLLVPVRPSAVPLIEPVAPPEVEAALAAEE